MNQPRQPKLIDPPTPDRLPAIIESLLFVAEEPQGIGTLAKTLGVPRQGVERAVEILSASVEDRGLLVQRLGDRIQLSTAPDAAPYIEQFLEIEQGHLSRASLETLAIIAYRQPVTRAMVEAVRGVNSDHSVSTLVARGLVEDVGRAPSPGRPVLFGTSIRFLEYFGLQRPDDLPPLPELVAAVSEQNAVAPESNGADDDDTPDDGEDDDAAVHSPAASETEDGPGAADGDASDDDEEDDAAVHSPATSASEAEDERDAADGVSIPEQFRADAAAQPVADSETDATSEADLAPA